MRIIKFIAIAGILFQCNTTVKNKTGITGKHFYPCPESPNCVSSMEDGEKHIRPLEFKGVNGMEKLAGFLQSYGNCEIVERSEDYIHAVFTTKIMRFRDDVEFYFTGDGSIQIKSASRVGYSDLGKNRSRLEKIRGDWVKFIQSL